MNDDTKACPECGGDGYFDTHTDEWSYVHGHYTDDHREMCERCDGTGVVEILEEDDDE